ncbi:CvfD/Ygs/GSP13 family RNA-binding post-transcriptional regulator [Lacticaseibacillus nasuensis]|uniref:CvfD/Ygs/GSP13 family RNA-binding post-transcriptional regulator n=1 Tax=Lacticaseibacillus nasuensis TaxID=944671 RepID=UPI002247B90A|nr:CvfD/Ygs/GSP13 family RNA-binding post-transcriptional regulator [Lacticaseibacillus nasuensis]MCX2456557.1 CvfD/Ygs/GSP13 family RNA-binding post-transcriptional regulator [Lacticaseibacillus nasuensis]
MDYRVGDIIDGRVTGIQPYGVFVLLDAHQQGLIHISECQHGYVERLSDHFKVGSTIQVMVLDIDEYSTKISLSVRALLPAPPMAAGRQHKHYWTSRRDRTGFTPIADRLPGWVASQLKELD